MTNIIDKYERGEVVGWDKDLAAEVRRAVTSGQLPLAGYFDSSHVMRALGDEPRQSRYQYRPLREAFRCSFNKEWKPQWQDYGTCVGQAGKHICDLQLGEDAIKYGNRFFPAAVAGTYPSARVEIGKSPGRWEGADTACMAEALVKVGVLLLSDLGLPEDALADDEGKAMAWTNSREGVPAEFESKMNLHKFASFTYAKNAEEVGTAMNAGAKAIFGSSYWSSGTRDAQGFGRLVSHRGGHCQAFNAVFFDEHGELQGVGNQNSWGSSYGTGPLPVDDFPPGGVGLTKDSVDFLCDRGGEVLLVFGAKLTERIDAPVNHSIGKFTT